MTQYIAAYDTENPACLAGVQRIVEIHERYQMPATFFFVAGLLDDQQAEYLSLLKDHPLFEIACHSYTHMPVTDAPRFCVAGPRHKFGHEIVESKSRIEEAFGCEVVGFRPPCAGPDGLVSAPEVLSLLNQAGYKYVSSCAWGPDCSLPAPLRAPFTYARQGFPKLWEIPACGWHENLLKGNNDIGPVLLCLFPPEMPETIPPGYVKTPEEEFAYNNKPFIDRALQDDMPVVTLIWHPWSLYRFDPGMRMLEMTFQYVHEWKIPATTFTDFWRGVDS